MKGGVPFLPLRYDQPFLSRLAGYFSGGPGSPRTGGYKQVRTFQPFTSNATVFFCSKYRPPYLLFLFFVSLQVSTFTLQFYVRSSSFHVHSSILSVRNTIRSLLLQVYFLPSRSLSLSLSLSAENNFSRSRRFCRMFCPLGSVNKTRSLVNRFS